jgi:hypothetical protein
MSSLRSEFEDAVRMQRHGVYLPEIIKRESVLKLSCAESIIEGWHWPTFGDIGIVEDIFKTARRLLEDEYAVTTRDPFLHAFEHSIIAVARAALLIHRELRRQYGSEANLVRLAVIDCVDSMLDNGGQDDYHPRDRIMAACVIQRGWRYMRSDPAFKMCRQRIDHH